MARRPAPFPVAFSRHSERLEARRLFSGANAVTGATPWDATSVDHSIAFGGRTKAVFVDADGSRVTVSLRGPGTGRVAFATAGDADPASLTLDGTTAASTLTVAGRTSVGGAINVTGGLKAFTGKSLSLTGTFAATGTVQSIRLDDVTDATITLGGGDPATVVAGDVFDTSLTSAGPIRSLKVGSWTDTEDTPADVVTAPTIDAVNAKRDFGASIATASLGRLVVGGQLNGDVRATDDIGTVTARTIGPVVVFAGVAPTATALPTSAADFVNPAAAIGTLSVKGTFAGAFAGASVAAPTIVRANLGGIDTSNDEVPFGVAADTIDSIAGRYEGSEPFKLKAASDPAQSATRFDFNIRLI